MGKSKQKSGDKGGIANKEAFQRMNYLYQAALTALYSNPAQPQLCRFYINTMKNISQRLVLRTDPSIKRTVCKGCDSLLIPGITCTSRLRARRQKHVVLTCLTCGMVKRFVINKEHTLWTERAENIVTTASSSIPLSSTN